MGNRWIAIRIAEKARDEWIRKAAKLRVEAQEVKHTGRYAGKPLFAEHDDKVRDIEADAAHAERTAQEWNDKASQMERERRAEATEFIRREQQRAYAHEVDDFDPSQFDPPPDFLADAP